LTGGGGRGGSFSLLLLVEVEGFLDGERFKLSAMAWNMVSIFDSL
jgi:hypothetical protein